MTSSPAGISCGLDCTEPFANGTLVNLTATPEPGSVFVGWGGDADCTDGRVLMGADKSCTATFKVRKRGPKRGRPVRGRPAS